MTERMSLKISACIAAALLLAPSGQAAAQAVAAVGTASGPSINAGAAGAANLASPASIGALGSGALSGISLAAPASLSLPQPAPSIAAALPNVSAARAAEYVQAAFGAVPQTAAGAIPLPAALGAHEAPRAAAAPAASVRTLAVRGKTFAKAQAGITAIKEDKAVAALTSKSEARAGADVRAAADAAFDNVKGRAPAVSEAAPVPAGAGTSVSPSGLSAPTVPGASYAPGTAGSGIAPAAPASPEARPAASGSARLVPYSVKRVLLSAIAGTFGVVVSLPSADPATERSILAQAAERRIVFSDYDDTLEKFKAIASPETVEALLALRKAGKDIVVITDRPDKNRDGSLKGTIVESLSSIPAGQRAGILFAANKGGRIFRYTAAGEPELVYEEPPLDAQTVASVKEAAEAVKARLAALGTALHDGSGGISSEGANPYGYAMMLKAGTPEAAVKAVAAALQAELQARGLTYEVEPRMAKDPKLPPYVTFSKLDKSLAVSRVAAILKVRPRDAVILGDSMFVPKAGKPGLLTRIVTRIAEWLSGMPAQLTGNGTDRDMEKALPGALTLSVGGTADPRMGNAYVMPGKGPEVTRKILRAVGSKAR